MEILFFDGFNVLLILIFFLPAASESVSALLLSRSEPGLSGVDRLTQRSVRTLESIPVAVSGLQPDGQHRPNPINGGSQRGQKTEQAERVNGSYRCAAASASASAAHGRPRAGSRLKLIFFSVFCFFGSDPADEERGLPVSDPAVSDVLVENGLMERSLADAV